MHLSVRTVGEKISGMTDFFIFPIMIRILERIMLSIRGLKARTIMTISIRVICVDGEDSSATTKRACMEPISTPRRAQKAWWQQASTQQQRIHSMSCMS